MFRKAPEGVAPRRAISIYDMLIPSYEFRDIPRNPAAESRSFGKRHLGETAQEGGKVVFDECGSMSLLAAFPERCHSLFPMLESHRIKIEDIRCVDKLKDSEKEI